LAAFGFVFHPELSLAGDGKFMSFFQGTQERRESAWQSYISGEEQCW